MLRFFKEILRNRDDQKNLSSRDVVEIDDVVELTNDNLENENFPQNLHLSMIRMR